MHEEVRRASFSQCLAAMKLGEWSHQPCDIERLGPRHILQQSRRSASRIRPELPLFPKSAPPQALGIIIPPRMLFVPDIQVIIKPIVNIHAIMMQMSLASRLRLAIRTATSIRSATAAVDVPPNMTATATMASWSSFSIGMTTAILTMLAFRANLDT